MRRSLIVPVAAVAAIVLIRDGVTRPQRTERAKNSMDVLARDTRREKVSPHLLDLANERRPCWPLAKRTRRKSAKRIAAYFLEESLARST